MLMKSRTFFSLGTAHASQVYTKTVNSGFFSALLTRFLNHFKQNIFHTFYSQTTGLRHNKVFKNIPTSMF